MLPSYESPLRFQEGWSSLQTHSRTPRNPPRGLTLQMGMLGNLKARTALRMCSKNLQLAPNCGTWASSPVGLNGLNEKPAFVEAAPGPCAIALKDRPCLIDDLTKGVWSSKTNRSAGALLSA